MSELVSRTSDFQVNPSAAGIQTASDVAAIRGGFAFSWLSVATSSVFRSLDNVIVVDAYRPDGSQLLPEIDLAEATFRHGGYRDPAIIATADQQIVVAWVEIEPVLSFASSWVRSGTIDLNGVTSSSTLVFAPVYGATSPLSHDIAP